MSVFSLENVFLPNVEEYPLSLSGWEDGIWGSLKGGMVGRGRITTSSCVPALLLFFFGTGGTISLYTIFSVCSFLVTLFLRNCSSAYLGFYEQMHKTINNELKVINIDYVQSFLSQEGKGCCINLIPNIWLTEAGNVSLWGPLPP